MRLHIVLVEPEIPQNTGNIARTCAATGAVLHLVKPYGFSLDEKHLKRAGLDYWHLVEIHEYASLQDFLIATEGRSLYYFSTKAPRSYCDVRFGEESWLVFGKETKGLPEDLLAGHYASCLRIPMCGEARSLNLSNSVAIATYEVLRQYSFPCLSSHGRMGNVMDTTQEENHE
ncbi:tRNA (cytidine(34)-2'-O)-methyltransferase [Parasphaerochaeta coccoides]|uniref:Putative tRNA (cytidine(34)-2'-O)-methyltransferase n=1 Tax=Parasphaerochaeta coccoides (strain ATCC BAA-1237 / DSM 17374 / SPN1) TaxID=760011 RepID=F4GIK3_PARC1|nr:tRNA (cytidine(34)-2'-O)-methyltransferase [Parasphaerochaeta coccoides]AEC02137.1 tRNA/rRNA methyltransferase (SpoU) [Parasphaerochaeta coccoides DSM 17374]